MGKFGSPAVPGLKKALKDKAAEVRPAAKAAIPLLVKSLGDADSDVRANSAKSIGQVGAEAGLLCPALVEKLKDPTVSVRVNAAEALGNLGSAANAAILEALPTASTATAQAASKLGPPVQVE